MTDDGLVKFKAAGTRQKPPDVNWPNFEGKGWNPAPTKEMLQLSAEFLQLMKDEKWTELTRVLKFHIDLDMINEDGFAPIHLAISKGHEQLGEF